MEIRRTYDRHISTMGLPILVKQHLYIESGPKAIIGIVLLTKNFIAVRNKPNSNKEIYFVSGTTDLQLRFNLSPVRTIAIAMENGKIPAQWCR